MTIVAARPAIAYCFDRDFADIAAVSAYSVCKTSRSDLDLYWVVPEADLDRVRHVRDTTKFVKDMNITLLAARSEVFSDWKTAYHITKGTYLRLLLPELIRSERLIYIDADTLALADLADLMSRAARRLFGARSPAALPEARLP